MIPVPHQTEDTSWLQHAACRGSDPEIFFPSRGENKALLRAKAICRDCPVRAECLQSALDNNEHHGIFGGTSERERRRIRLRNNKELRQQEMQGR